MAESIPVYETKTGLQMRTEILNAIHQERLRQEVIHPKKLDLAMRYVTLGEEHGEVGKAIQDNDMSNLFIELIQNAAVCVRMAEDVLKITKSQEG